MERVHNVRHNSYTRKKMLDPAKALPASRAPVACALFPRGLLAQVIGAAT
jgi:hypothetical protein